MENGIERIAGLVFSGLAVRLMAAGFALWLGFEAASFIGAAFDSVAAGWPK